MASPAAVRKRCPEARTRPEPRPAPGTSKTTTNQASQFVFRNTPIGLESHSKVPPCSRVGPLLQPVVFAPCFIGWRPASGVGCFVSGGLNWAFPVDKHVWISDTDRVLESEVGVSGGSLRPGRRGRRRLRPALCCASRCAAAPRYLAGTARRGGGGPARAHGPTRALPRPPAPSRASPRVPLDTGVMDFRASETAFRRPFCLAAGPEPRFRQTSTSESRRRFKSFLCGGPKSNSCDARNKIWIFCQLSTVEMAAYEI